MMLQLTLCSYIFFSLAKNREDKTNLFFFSHFEKIKALYFFSMVKKILQWNHWKENHWSSFFLFLLRRVSNFHFTLNCSNFAYQEFLQSGTLLFLLFLQCFNAYFSNYVCTLFELAQRNELKNKEGWEGSSLGFSAYFRYHRFYCSGNFVEF